MKKNLVTVLVILCLSMSSGAQTMSASHQMNPEVEQAIAEMRATHSNAEVLKVLGAIQDRSAQATQVILASMSTFDLEQRNEILFMLFQLPRAKDGLNATHIPLLVQLFVKSVQYRPASLGLVLRWTPFFGQDCWKLSYDAHGWEW